VTGTLTIAARFNGPPGSGNGGYVCGLLAEHLATPARLVMTVTLRRPPPLEQQLVIDRTSDQLVELRRGGDVVAEARPAADVPSVVEPVAPSAVAIAEEAYRGRTNHPFPTCFVCGTQRAPGDGLRLRPGPVSERSDTTACAWIPDASLADPEGRIRPEFVWAALDCPGAWTLDLAGRPMVLGRMSALVDAVPHVGDACTVMGHLIGRDGRKTFTATTLYTGDGTVLGRASATWLEVDPRVFAAAALP
jgi:hypothetical protein